MDQNTYLVHFGTKGMKWGVRKYQNEDGSLTKAGERRYARDVKRYNSIQKTKARSADRLERAKANELEYEYKRDKKLARRFKTDLTYAAARKYDRKRARAHMEALKQESANKKADIRSKELVKAMETRYGKTRVADLGKED